MKDCKAGTFYRDEFAPLAFNAAKDSPFLNFSGVFTRLFFLRFKGTWVMLLSSGARKLWWQSPPCDCSLIWACCVVTDFLREALNQWVSHTSHVLSVFFQFWGLYCCQTPLRGVLSGVMALSITGHRHVFSGCGEKNLPWWKWMCAVKTLEKEILAGKINQFSVIILEADQTANLPNSMSKLHCCLL